MPSTDRTERLFTNVVRLRAAQRQLPDDEGLAAVLTDLEAELGPTVSRNLAAKLLGVSHTALQRWVDTGDIPVVTSPKGRSAVPVPALLRLFEDVRDERSHGRRRRHVLEPVLREGRLRAERLDPASLPGTAAGGGRHHRAERRALAYHAALAERLDADDIHEARRQLHRWRHDGRIDERYASRWEDLLAQPLPVIKQKIAEGTPDAADLRQNSPLAGLLSEPERRRIIELVQ